MPIQLEKDMGGCCPHSLIAIDEWVILHEVEQVGSRH